MTWLNQLYLLNSLLVGDILYFAYDCSSPKTMAALKFSAITTRLTHMVSK